VSRRSRRRQAELEWRMACDDARRLAVELAAGRPYWPIDVMHLGFVLETCEAAYRYVPATISQFDSSVGLWPNPSPVWILITDQRLLIRHQHGVVVPLWWNSVIALDINLQEGRVILDHGDNEPRWMTGPALAAIAVGAVGGVYGVAALLRHPTLEILRRSNATRPAGAVAV